MNNILILIKEVISSRGIINRMAQYEDQADYQNHYLGLAWQIINPLIQIATYYLVFGVGLRGNRGPVDGVPFITWMLIGISCWFFINKSVLGCSNSIHQKIGMVSKMKFPVSILPAVNIRSHMTTLAVMMGVALIFVFSSGVRPTLYWLQVFYYLFAMVTFLYFFGILNATLTVLVRDYHFVLKSVIRIVFYFSGPIWVITPNTFGPRIYRILELNPFQYLIHGFRDTFLNRGWFFERPLQTLFFWLLTLFIAILGSHLHLKFRSKFIDFV